jgi:hypothetical protein
LLQQGVVLDSLRLIEQRMIGVEERLGAAEVIDAGSR